MELDELKACSYKPSKMTREEETIKQVEIYTDNVSNLAEWGDGWEDYNDYEYVKKAFIKGAKWADKTMIEKACEWLSKALDNFFIGTQQANFTDKVKFIESFKKAMRNNYETLGGKR